MLFPDYLQFNIILTKVMIIKEPYVYTVNFYCVKTNKFINVE